MTWLKGVDVSACQPAEKIDWKAVRASGREFVVIKHTEGTLGRDPARDRHRDGARSAGLRWGAYSFARPSADPSSARVQVARLWDTLPGQMPDLEVALDLEVGGGLPGRAVLDFAQAWVEEWAAYSAVPPWVYTGKWFFESLGPLDAEHRRILSACPLWIAAYWQPAPWEPVEGRDSPRVPEPWADWDMWQSGGDHGVRVPGIPTAVDTNVFRGDLPRLLALMGVHVDRDAPTIPENVGAADPTDEVADWAVDAYQKRGS